MHLGQFEDIFGVNSRLPILDGYLSGSHQSIVVEMTFMTVLYLVFMNASNRIFRSIFRKYRFWYTAHRSPGVVNKNAQDDLPFVLALGIHHGIAAAFFLWGRFRSDPDIWRHGYLIESGYEIGDTLSMIVGLVPYKNIKRALIIPFLCHHIPGVSLAWIFLTSSDLRFNPHLMNIIVWLLLASSFGMFTAFFAYTLDLRKNIMLSGIAQNANLLFFGFARLYVFPKEVSLLIQDLRQTATPDSERLIGLLYVMGGLFMVFNLGIVITATPDFLVLLKNAFTGNDPYKLTVEPPAEGRMPRRKSSILMDFSPLQIVHLEHLARENHSKDD